MMAADKQRRAAFGEATTSSVASGCCIVQRTRIIRPGDSILLVRCCYDNVAEPECFTTYLAMADRLHVSVQALACLLACTPTRAHRHDGPVHAMQIPCETLLWRLERHHSVADGLLQLVQQKEVDALVCATPGSRCTSEHARAYHRCMRACAGAALIRTPAMHTQPEEARLSDGAGDTPRGLQRHRHQGACACAIHALSAHAHACTAASFYASAARMQDNYESSTAARACGPADA